MRATSICVACISIASFFVSPVAAGAIKLESNLSPRANVFAALSRRSEAGLTKRETKAEAAARIRAVRLAAVRAARASAAAQLASIRATATRPNATPTNANGPPAPAPTSDVNPTPPAFPGTESAELAAIRIAIQKTRCGSDRACEAKFEQSGLPLPPNGAALCNRTIRNCVLGCAAGFTFAPNSTNCVPEITTCGANACGTLANGSFSCSGNNVCTPACDTNVGFTLVFVNGAPTCKNVAVDPAFCGSPPRVCPAGYNGKGSAVCRSGVCSLVCPPGSALRETSSSEPFCS